MSKPRLATQRTRRLPRQLPLPGFEPTPGTPGTTERRFACAVCAVPLDAAILPDGRRWTAAVLAMHGRRQHKAVLCWRHYALAEGQADAACG